LTLELNKKRCLKTYSKKAKNVQKMIPNSGSKSEGIFGVASRGAPLAAYFIFWGLLGPSWGLLGPSWSHLGASWGHLGASWGLLGAILGPFWGLLGPYWGLLCCTIPGPAECAKRLNKHSKHHACQDPRWRNRKVCMLQTHAASNRWMLVGVPHPEEQGP